MPGPSPSASQTVRRVGVFAIFAAGQDEAADIATIARTLTPVDAAAGFDQLARDGDVERMLQTGHRFLVAQRDGVTAGFVRSSVDEGIGWFDLLAASVTGAGRALVRAIEMQAQEEGLRLVRCRAPEGILDDYFAWLGYLPISREGTGDATMLVLERRLPLLTVRDQRREDAAFISGLTGRDSYVFEMGARPGWFVAADGDRPVGVTWVADGGAGVAEIAAPILLDRYRHRGLEVWMLERATVHAQHAGYHSARVSTDDWLRDIKRDLEDRQWFPEGEAFERRSASTPPAGEDATDDDW